MERNFMNMIQCQQGQGKFVCVGLDPNYSKFPECKKRKGVQHDLLEFLKDIVDATCDIVGAYKPNIAFFEAHGIDGLLALERTMRYIRSVAPEVPIILDAKRGDIGNTNNGYADSAFKFYEADAITVNPYFGREALEPFFQWKDKGIIVLCRTSNLGAEELQEGLMETSFAPIPLYRLLAQNIARKWNNYGNCLVVAGATNPEPLRIIRREIGDMGILIPGLGTQGGDLEATVMAGKNSREEGIIPNSSSGIIHASKEADFAQVARRETIKLHEAIQNCLS